MTGETVRGMPYAELRRLRRGGLVPAAAGPCEIEGCRSLKQPGWPPVRQDRFVYEHCHRHGTVRGVVCLNCNQLLAILDNGGAWFHDWPPAGQGMYPPRAAYEAFRQRCLECAAGAGTLA